MNRDLPLLAFSLMIWGTGEGMFFFFQPLYLQQMGADPVTIGGILGMVGLAMTIVHIPAGYLSDRFGRRPLLWAAWSLGAVATMVMALSDSIQGFVAGAVLYGLTAFVASPLSSYVTAARGNLSTARALTLTSAAYNFGAVLGPVLGGWIGQNFGFQRIFLYSSIFFVISTFIIFFLRPQSVEKFVYVNPLQGIGALTNPRFITLSILIFTSFMVMYLPQPLSQNYLQNEKALNLVQIGQLLSLRSIGIVILNLLLGRINPKFGFLISQGLMIIFSFIIWQGESMEAYLVAYFLLGSYQTARIFANAQARDLIEPQIMGLTYGIIETILASIIILAPPMAGYIYSISPSLVYPVSIILIALSLLVNLFIRVKDHFRLID